MSSLAEIVTPASECSEWQTVQLGSLGFFLKGKGIRKDEAKSGNIPCIRYGELYTRHHNIIRKHWSHISREVAATSVKLKSGDILFACSGETKEEIGKSAAFLGTYEAFAGGDIIILRQEEVDPALLGYLLNSAPVSSQKESKGQGDAVVHINATALSDIVISLPTPTEQKAIASALSDVDALIENLEALIAKKRDIKTATMHQLLNASVRLAGHTSKIRKEEIRSFIDLLTGYPFPSSGYVEAGVRLLRGSNIKRGETDWESELVRYWPLGDRLVSEYELRCSDVVIAMDGSLVGRSFAQLSDNDLPALLLQRVARLRAKSDLDQNYLKEWICGPFFTKHCDSVKTVTAIPHISPEDIRSFQISFPEDIQEQKEIALVLSNMEAEIDLHAQRLMKLQQVKQGMMRELLTGRTRLI